MEVLRRRSSVGAGVAAAVLMVLSGLAAPLATAAAPWGACGTGTDESKVVVRYALNHRMYATLRCGGPRWDANPTWGYRHILARHRGDFERLAVGTNQNWRDVADLAMDAIARDPDAAKPAGDGKGCYSRLISLRNLRTNQVVRTQIIRMYIVISSGDIVTLYPHSAQCP
jgi:hypothetical protein